MSQTIVNTAQDQWQKGQIAKSHYVRDISRKSADVDEIGFGELVVWGPNPETDVRQPDATVAAVTGKSYAIVSGVVTVTSAAHGLQINQEVIIANDSYTPGAGAVLDGTYIVTGTPTSGTFTFATTEADRTSETLDYSVAAFVQKDIAGIVYHPVTGGRAKRFSDGALTISAGQTVTIVREADIVIELGGTVSAEADAYYVNTPGGTYPVHTFVGDADSGNAVKIPGTFSQAGIAGDIVMMRFNTDAVLGS